MKRADLLFVQCLEVLHISTRESSKPRQGLYTICLLSSRSLCNEPLCHASSCATISTSSDTERVVDVLMESKVGLIHYEEVMGVYDGS